MTIHTENLTQELEQEGKVKTAVIGVRYIGQRSSMSPGTLRRQAGWPGDTPFQGGTLNPETGVRGPGRLQIGINPDWIDDDTVSGGTVAGIESNNNFEVVYAPAEIARALLERNFLPPKAFGGEGVSYEPPVREALFEKLGLEDMGTCPAATQDYREALAEIAGVEDVDEREMPEDKQRKQTYLQDYTRAELMDAVMHVAGSESAGEDLSWDPNDHTVDEVREHVQSIDSDDIITELSLYRSVEQAGENRKTALKAIDSRLSSVLDQFPKTEFAEYLATEDAVTVNEALKEASE